MKPQNEPEEQNQEVDVDQYEPSIQEVISELEKHFKVFCLSLSSPVDGVVGSLTTARTEGELAGRQGISRWAVKQMDERNPVSYHPLLTKMVEFLMDNGWESVAVVAQHGKGDEPVFHFGGDFYSCLGLFQHTAFELNSSLDRELDEYWAAGENEEEEDD